MKNPVFQQHGKALAEYLGQSRNIVITTHHKPDGDALGSSLALAGVLKKAGHHVEVVSPSEFPAFLNWMKGSEQVIDFIKNPEKAKKVFSNAELICCLDFNDPKRVEGMNDILMNAPGHRLLIDHHLDPKDFCKYVFSDPKTPSTCELVYQLLEVLNLEDKIQKDEAECLYAGIMTDTGSFRFNSVRPLTHQIVARLLEAGARNDFVHEKVYDTFSENRLRFLGHTLLNCMFVLPEYKTVYFRCTQSEMDQYGHEPGDLEGIVNYGLSIRGIIVSVLFSERDKLVKISFRSKGDFSVKQIAEKYFDGGGHRNAAGGRSSSALDDTINKFKSILSEYKELSASE